MIIVSVVSSNRALYHCAVASLDLMQQIVAMYERHGWSLRRILLRPNTSPEIELLGSELFRDAEVREADLDALWFARSSHGKRESWELRLLADQPYALFEAFEADESEEETDGKSQRRKEGSRRNRAGQTEEAEDCVGSIEAHWLWLLASRLLPWDRF